MRAGDVDSQALPGFSRLKWLERTLVMRSNSLVLTALAASLFGHTDGGRPAGPIVPLLQLHLGSAVTQVTSI